MTEDGGWSGQLWHRSVGLFEAPGHWYGMVAIRQPLEPVLGQGDSDSRQHTSKVENLDTVITAALFGFQLRFQRPMYSQWSHGSYNTSRMVVPNFVVYAG